MKDKFKKLRNRLHMTIDKYGLKSEETMEISNKFDDLVNVYYKKEIQYKKDSIMYIKYVESIEVLKKTTKDFSKFPTVEEWNKYAYEKDLLCSESLKYISGLNWHYLRNNILTNI